MRPSLKVMLSRLGGLIYRQRRLLLLGWVGLLLICLVVTLLDVRPLPLTESTGATDTEAYRVLSSLRDDFGYTLGNDLALVYRPNPAGKVAKPNLEPELRRDLAREFPAIQSISGLAGKRDPNLRLLLIAFRPEIDFTRGQALVRDMHAWLAGWEQRSGQEAWLTGNLAFYSDIAHESETSIGSAELFALIVAYLVLVCCFGGLLAALLPILIGAATLVLLDGLLRLAGLDTTPMSATLNSLLGLALAIDYSLFIVSRFQEELARPERAPGAAGLEAALRATLAQAGKTILVSAAIVMVSIAVLLIPDLSGSRIMARNLLLVVMISALSATLVLPALLALAPRLLAWPRPLSELIRRYDSYAAWRRFAHHVTAYPGRYFLLSLLLLTGLSAPVTGMKLWDPVQTLASPASESRRGYELLQADGWGGQMVPITVIVRARDGAPIDSDAGLRHIHALSRYLQALPEVEGLQSLASLSPPGPEGADPEAFIRLYRQASLLQNLVPGAGFPASINTRSGGDRHLIAVFPANVMDVAQSQRIADRIRAWAATHPDFETLCGGVVERARDFTEALYRPTPVMVLLVLAGIFSLLFAYMRALILPLKAALMNFVPILGAFGVLTLVYQHGLLHDWLGTPHNGAVTSIVPITLFCIVFGLSMDYEVLILSRISEAYAEGGEVRPAVIEGMARSGSVITGAALIFFSVFLPAVFSPSPAVKELGLGIVTAVIIDATLLRLLLVPSFMMLMGKWNWWSPFQLLRPGADAGRRPGAAERPESPD